MTLIACLHPSQCRTLIADTLITSRNSPVDDFVFPTRIYIPPRKEFKPVALLRKIVEISPTVVALWAGDLDEARRFADRAAVYFDGRTVVDEDSLEKFLSDNYSQHGSDFHAIIAPADQGSALRVWGSGSGFFSFRPAITPLLALVSNSSGTWWIGRHLVATGGRQLIWTGYELQTIS